MPIEALKQIVTNATSEKRQSPKTQLSQPTITMFVKQ